MQGRLPARGCSKATVTVADYPKWFLNIFPPASQKVLFEVIGRRSNLAAMDEKADCLGPESQCGAASVVMVQRLDCIVSLHPIFISGIT